MRIVNWLNQNQGFVIATLTLVYVATTILIALMTLKAVKVSEKNFDLAIQLEKNRIRPYVLFNLSSSIAQRNTYASVKNLGLTAAYNIRISINPKLEHHYDVESPLTSRLILFLPPSEEITDVIDSSPAFHQKYPESVFEGVVEYEDSQANEFKAPFRIDLTFLKKRIYVREPTTAGELKQLNETVAAIAKQLKNLERSNYVEAEDES